MISFKKMFTLTLCGALALGMTACAGSTGTASDGSSSTDDAGLPSSSQVESVDSSTAETETPSSTGNPGTAASTYYYYEDAAPYVTNRRIPTASEVAAGTAGAAGEETRPFTAQQVAWNGPAGYSIVLPASADKLLVEAADELAAYFKTNAKVTLPIVRDSTAASGKEIRIGATNRGARSCKEGEFYAELNGTALCFGGGHPVTVKKAVQCYTRLPYAAGKAGVFSGSSDFVANRLGYRYVWGDEFEGTKLDLTRWERTTSMSGTAELTTSGDEEYCHLENGYLKMIAARYWSPKAGGAQFVAPWAVSTGDTMGFRYGYLEMRAKMPFLRGAWPSLWTSSNGALGARTDFDYTIEVDIFENFASLDTIAPNIHKWYKVNQHTQWNDPGEKYTFANTDNLSNEYHTYGFEWTQKTMSMYVDGKKYFTYDLTKNFDAGMKGTDGSVLGASGMSGFETNLMLILNCHLFTDSSDYKPYTGCEINVRDLPVEYDIDWIRLYQKSGDGSQLVTAH